MKIAIRHHLRVSLGSGNARAVEQLLLMPSSGAGQTVSDWLIQMPGIETAARFTDAFGNRALLVDQSRPDGELVISIKGTVETQDRNGVLGRPSGEPGSARADLRRRPDEADPLRRARPRRAGRRRSRRRRHRRGGLSRYHDVLSPLLR